MYYGYVVIGRYGCPHIYLEKEEYEHVQRELNCVGLAPNPFITMKDMDGWEHRVNRSYIVCVVRKL